MQHFFAPPANFNRKLVLRGYRRTNRQQTIFYMQTRKGCDPTPLAHLVDLLMAFVKHNFVILLRLPTGIELGGLLAGLEFRFGRLRGNEGILACFRGMSYGMC